MKPNSSTYRSCRWKSVSFATLVLGLAAYATASGPLGFGIAQPRVYESPSGIFSLHVRPHDRGGHGSASYRMMKSGEEVWAADKAYTLRAVSVTNSGKAVGIAYRNVSVERDGKAWDADAYFHVVILDKSGTEVLNDISRRHHVHHSSPEPYAKQIIVDEANDHVVLRIQGEERKCESAQWGGPSWWVYRLSDGQLYERFDPRQRDPEVDDRWCIVDTQLIGGTPLMITHWYTEGPHTKPEERAGRYTVVDIDGRPIWSRLVEGDYAELDLSPKRWGSVVVDHFRKEPAILPTDDKHTFRLRFFAAGTMTRYHVERDVGAQWSISERETKPFARAKPSTTAAPVCGELAYLGAVQIGASSASAFPFGKIHRFTFDRLGHIHFSFRDSGGEWGTRAINAKGEITEEVYVEDGSPQTYIHWNDCPRVGDDQYVEVREVSKDPREYDAMLVNLATGESAPLAGYPGGYARSITRARDGGFALVNDAGLARYDGRGELLWSIDSEARDILGMLPWSVAFLKGRRLALLTGDEVKLLDRDGHPQQAIDLTGAFGNTDFDSGPGYLHEVVADAEGGFLIKNSRNPPVVLRYDENGTLRSRWSPRFPDGRIFSIRPGIRVAPNGRLWTSDGRAFMRLTEDGVVEHVVGGAREDDMLTELAGFTVGWNGRWYAVESGTGAVFVFDQLGRRQFVAKPRPGDFTGSVRKANVVVTPDGEIYVKRPSTKVYLPPDEYLRFDSTGRPQSVIAFEPRLGADWAFQPGTGYRCGICPMRGDDRLMVVNPPDQVIHETRKRPNGKWFGYQAVFAVAPDGTMAVMTTERRNDERLYALDLFTAEAEGIRTIPLPPPVQHYTGLAFDGIHAVVVGNHDAVVVDLPEDATTKWTLSGLQDTNRSWQAFLIADGRELLLFDRFSKELHRYELP